MGSAEPAARPPDPTSGASTMSATRTAWVNVSADRQRRVETMSERAFMDEDLERAMVAVSSAADTVLAPWGGAAACIDAYETAVRAATDAQLSVARVIDVEPVRSLAACCANLTRDIGAAQLSRARWILDV